MTHKTARRLLPACIWTVLYMLGNFFSSIPASGKAPLDWSWFSIGPAIIATAVVGIGIAISVLDTPEQSKPKDDLSAEEREILAELRKRKP